MTTQARVFYVGKAPHDPRQPSWYWLIEEPHGPVHGPYATALQAGKAAREAILAEARSKDEYTILDELRAIEKGKSLKSLADAGPLNGRPSFSAVEE